MEETNKKNLEVGGSTGTGAVKAAAQSKSSSGSDPLSSANAPFETGKSGMKPDWERELDKATERGSRMIENAKQTITDAYDKTGKALGTTYERAKEYGSEHPGTMTLVALGVGVGLGFMLAQNTRLSARSRAQRIVPPVMNALSQVVTELFD